MRMPRSIVGEQIRHLICDILSEGVCAGCQVAQRERQYAEQGGDPHRYLDPALGYE